jgi:hypothetical protein
MTDIPENETGPKAKSKSKNRSKKKTAPSQSTVKGTIWTFPKVSLEDALRIPKSIEEKNAGNPTPASVIAEAVGYKISDWRFKDLLRAASQYGLVTGTGATATVHLTPLGQDIVAPSSPSQRSAALLRAFEIVEQFAAVQKYYGDKRIPEDEFFLNTLTREFKIPRDRAEQFAKIFVDNIKYLRAFHPGAGLLKAEQSTLAGRLWTFLEAVLVPQRGYSARCASALRARPRSRRSTSLAAKLSNRLFVRSSNRTRRTFRDRRASPH